MKIGAPLLAVVITLLIVLTQSVYTVDQRQYAIVFQLGEIVNVKDAPGLHWKLPFMQNVRFFDKRILTLDSPEPERITTSEKKSVLVDSFVKWRIIDVKLYYVSVAGDEEQAKHRLSQTVNSLLREQFGRRTIHDVVSGKRDEVMELTRKNADQDARKIGVEIVDLRVRHVELPQEVSGSVYQRMEAERKRVANDLRSRGGADKEKIQADADKQSEIIRADAYRQAQVIKGKGDAKAAAIYAAAYGQNAEFYAFYRSLEAYRTSFRSKSDVMVLDPSSEFFKYLKSAGAGKSSK
jgi:modulator of FtsH protease HflC